MPKWPPLRASEGEAPDARILALTMAFQCGDGGTCAPGRQYSGTELPHSTDKSSQIARASRADVLNLLSSTNAANVAEMADRVAEVNGNTD
jgi:hypothetical protein